MAREMLLSDHHSVVYCMKFNSAGTVIASGFQDKDISLWHVHGDCKKYMVLRGHKNDILVNNSFDIHSI